ncbi:hypothetical protein SGLAM104S_08725 [Streptomyces glaucescens]
MEVCLRGLGRGDGDGAADADLAALRGPVEAEGGVGAGGELAAFAAAGVAREAPAVLFVGAVQHHRADVRQAVLVGGGQGHGVGFGLSGRHRLREPGREEGEWGDGGGGRVEGGEGVDVPHPQ